jgi:putative DNA methylase
MPKDSAIRATFGRQAIPMSWDFAEANPFEKSSGSFAVAIRNVADAVAAAGVGPAATVSQKEAGSAVLGPAIICTDPPYYDNIGYADLSDYFYVWHRRALRDVFPDFFSTVLTPKSEELIASSYRFGDRTRAQEHFENGLATVFSRIRAATAIDYPVTVFYAFKQAESTETDGLASTGWEVMLNAMIGAGLRVLGTWPLRTEGATRLVSMGTNALASSIVLVCRPRPDDAGITDRKAFLAELRSELPEALRLLQHGNIAPVDLAQASIGPGMAVFSKYAKVVEPSGEPMTVRTALGLINQVLGEVLTEQEDDFDADTRWAITWFEEHRYGEGKYGDAELLSKAKVTAVSGLVDAGIVESRVGKVRLLRSEELKPDWNPATDRRTPIWEITQRLIFALNKGGGVGAAADIVRRTGGRAEVAKELAYRLYVTCERKSWADEARDFNSLVVDWPEITKLASGIGPGQTDLGLGG